jgi:excisionase family DNA binding protein
MALPAPARRTDTGARHSSNPAARNPNSPPPHADKKLYRIPEAMRLLSLSRSVIYNQIRTGRLRSVKEGSTRLIPADAIVEYIALLEAEAEAAR